MTDQTTRAHIPAPTVAYTRPRPGQPRTRTEQPRPLAYRIEAAIRRLEEMHWATIDWLPALGVLGMLGFLWIITR